MGVLMNLTSKIVTIDGPSGVGKGTLSHLLAKKLGWDFLDSGALYRITAYVSHEKGLAPDDANAIADLARHLQLEFKAGHIIFEGHNIEAAIRREEMGILASKVGAHQIVRDALYDLQRSFAKPGRGLVADGRDMGTAIFPEARLKLFLTASAKERAQRRFLQLQAHDIHVNITDLLREIEARDQRDQTRSASPLRPAKDAIIIDTSALSIDEVFSEIWRAVVAQGVDS